jgi:hypothetical protein
MALRSQGARRKLEPFVRRRRASPGNLEAMAIEANRNRVRDVGADAPLLSVLEKTISGRSDRRPVFFAGSRLAAGGADATDIKRRDLQIFADQLIDIPQNRQRKPWKTRQNKTFAKSASH